jgi:RNA polymerase sigma-70 factor, ECF subfamily
MQMIETLVRERVDAVYRSESRRILATLIRLLGDFELAEDTLHDAVGARKRQYMMWSVFGVKG